METLFSILLRHPTWEISVRHDKGPNAYRVQFSWQSPSPRICLRVYNHLPAKKLQQVRCLGEWVEKELAKLEEELCKAIHEYGLKEQE